MCELLAGALYLAMWRARTQEEGLTEAPIADGCPLSMLTQRLKRLRVSAKVTQNDTTAYTTKTSVWCSHCMGH